MRANVLAILEDDDRSIPWLARKMADAGCAIDQAVLWKALRRDRRILVDEALAISSVLDTSIAELTSGADCGSADD